MAGGRFRRRRDGMDLIASQLFTWRAWCELGGLACAVDDLGAAEFHGDFRGQPNRIARQRLLRPGAAAHVCCCRRSGVWTGKRHTLGVVRTGHNGSLPASIASSKNEVVSVGECRPHGFDDHVSEHGFQTVCLVTRQGRPSVGPDRTRSFDENDMIKLMEQCVHRRVERPVTPRASASASLVIVGKWPTL